MFGIATDDKHLYAFQMPKINKKSNCSTKKTQNILNTCYSNDYTSNKKTTKSEEYRVALHYNYYYLCIDCN